ncbi:MAG: hypothetical protein H6744_01395 [Deltaproteobacteria bacterium]|nr:hypothetical protein [Deltaproteobacteria bacterium]
MAYYPHPEGSAPRFPTAAGREAAPPRWWHTRRGVAGVAAMVAGIMAAAALVTVGLLQVSQTAQAWWLAERTAALQHEMDVQAHGREAEQRLSEQRVAFHLGYVGMALDRSRSDAERVTVLRLLDGFDGDEDVQRWAHAELAETEARLAAGLGRPGVADDTADAILLDEGPIETDLAEAGETGEAGETEDGAEADQEAASAAEAAEPAVAVAAATPRPASAAPVEAQASVVTAVRGDSQVQLYSVREVRPAAARPEAPVAAASPPTPPRRGPRPPTPPHSAPRPPSAPSARARAPRPRW